MYKQCPICENDTPDWDPGEGGGIRVKCNVCGSYKTLRSVIERYYNLIRQHPYRYALQGHIREANERGEIPLLTHENIQDYLTEPRDGILDQLDHILLYIVRHWERIGQKVNLNPERDYPIAFAKDAAEFANMLDELQEIGHLEVSRLGGLLGEHACRLKPQGLKRVDEIRPRQIGAGKQCFVAMWFADELNEVYSSGFEPAIRDAGYDPVRIDKVHHNEKICDRIIAEIRRSRFVVADFTGHRGGVYFEAGFAMGLGLPVIWTCRTDELNKTHFDTRQYNHIEWQTSEDLRRKLYDRICATVPVVSTGRPA